MKKVFTIILFCFVFLVSTSAQESITKQQFSGYKEMVAAAKTVITEISAENFHAQYTRALETGNPDFILIDIRTEAEYNEGNIPGAFLIQRGTLESGIEKDAVWEAFNHEKPKKADTIILVCRSGSRTALAAQTLMMLGYTNVKSLAGGWRDWNAKYPNLKKIN